MQIILFLSHSILSSKPFLDLDRMFFVIVSREIFSIYLTLTQFY
jgi:hypothetical protein